MQNKSIKHIVLEGSIDFIRRIGIFRRLSVTFVLIIIIPNLIIAVMNIRNYSAELEGLVTENLLFITEVISDKLNDQLSEYEAITFEINTDEEVYDFLKRCEMKYHELPDEYLDDRAYNESKNQLSYLLYNAASAYTYITSLQIVTDYDQINQSWREGFEKGGYIEDLQTFRNSENFIGAIEAKGYPVWYDTTNEIGVFYYQRNRSGTLSDYMTIMRSVIDPINKTHLGVVVMTVDIRFIRNELNFNNLSDMGNILLVSPEHSLFSLNENLDAPTIKDNPALLQTITATGSGHFSYEIDGHPSVVFCQKIDGIDFYIVQIVEENVLYSRSLRIVKENAVIVTICILVALFFAFIVTQSISSPLKRLKSEMANVSKQNLDIHYEDSAKDEITELGNKFNEMIGDIKKLINDLYISRIKKNESDYKKKEAELNALQMQIKPHFLYNTLDIIRWEALYHDGGESKLSRMIENLSELLRFGVKTNVNLVTVQEEIKHVEAYLKVINHKFQYPVELEYHLEEGIAKSQIAKLSLQPLVENAVLHGFDTKKAGNKVSIHGDMIEGTIEITVRDNGKGMPENTRIDLNRVMNEGYRDSTEAIGLNNVNDRIKLYFGNEYGISIRAYDIGTAIVIRVPMTSEG